jgi:hypothetical protein
MLPSPEKGSPYLWLGNHLDRLEFRLMFETLVVPNQAHRAGGGTSQGA